MPTPKRRPRPLLGRISRVIPTTYGVPALVPPFSCVGRLRNEKAYLRKREEEFSIPGIRLTFIPDSFDLTERFHRRGHENHGSAPSKGSPRSNTQQYVCGWSVFVTGKTKYADRTVVLKRGGRQVIRAGAEAHNAGWPVLPAVQQASHASKSEAPPDLVGRLAGSSHAAIAGYGPCHTPRPETANRISETSSRLSCFAMILAICFSGCGFAHSHW